MLTDYSSNSVFVLCTAIKTDVLLLQWLHVGTTGREGIKWILKTISFLQFGLSRQFSIYTTFWENMSEITRWNIYFEEGFLSIRLQIIFLCNKLKRFFLGERQSRVYLKLKNIIFDCWIYLENMQVLMMLKFSKVAKTSIHPGTAHK